MNLCKIDYSLGAAVQNMAVDAWMLEHVSASQPVIYRPYGWVSKSFTFGYTQRFKDIIDRIPPDCDELCRRPSGGGIVDHRNDWTYSVAVSLESELAKMKPLMFYQKVHESLSRSMNDSGAETELYVPKAFLGNPIACFDSPSPFDVVQCDSGLKVAGAALKRTKKGILLQGSVSRFELSGVDCLRFEKVFDGELMELAGLSSGIQNLKNPKDDCYLDFERKFACLSWNNKR